MGTLDEIRAAYGDDFFDRRPRSTIPSIHGLCICGHLDRYHSPSIGGLYVVPGPVEQRSGTVSTVFHGCVGALRSRGFEAETVTANREERTAVRMINPTCPCEDLRTPVSVDRPNRFFNQRMPADRSDNSRHPFMTGIRAFTTHLSKRKAAVEDPTWVDREFEDRFRWVDDMRVCSISTCKVMGEDVFPAFVNGDGLSELRCSSHR